jgi:hypothetical protein
MRIIDVTRSGGANRPVWFSAVGFVTVALLLSGCAEQPRSTQHPSPAAASATPVRAGDGLVVGQIQACNGIARGGRRGFVAGTVIALRGLTTVVPESAGVTRTVLPTVRSGSQTVSKNKRYRFVLPAGAYVLAAHYARGGNVEPWVPVTIRSGVVTHQDIPNECI